MKTHISLLMLMIQATLSVNAYAQCASEPTCGCPQSCNPPSAPRDFPESREGGYVEPPPVGTEVGESGGYGVTGFGLHFPELFFSLPTLKLPGLVKYRSRPRMIIESRVAPYVENVERREFGTPERPRDEEDRDFEPREAPRPSCGYPGYTHLQRPVSVEPQAQFAAWPAPGDSPRQYHESNRPVHQYSYADYSPQCSPVSNEALARYESADTIYRMPSEERSDFADIQQRFHQLERLLENVEQCQARADLVARNVAARTPAAQASTAEYIQSLDEPGKLRLVSEMHELDPVLVEASSLGPMQILWIVVCACCGVAIVIAAMCLRTLKAIALGKAALERDIRLQAADHE